MEGEDRQLLVGIDRRGQLAWLGEDDSAGLPVGYIDRYRQCWVSSSEHDLTTSARIIHYYFALGAGQQQRSNWQIINVLAEHCCQDSSNHRAAALSGLAALAYSRRLGQQLDNEDLAVFLVQSLLARTHFSTPEELAAAWERWRREH